MANKIKVVIIINDFLVGGAQRLIAQLLRHVDRDRFDFSVVTLFEFPGKANLYAELPAEIPTKRFAFSGISDFGSWFYLAKYLHRQRPDVVLSNLFFSNTVVRVLGLFQGYVSIPCEHNTYINKPKWQRIVDRILAISSYKIIAVSKTVADFTSKQEGIPLEDFVVIHNGIDVDQANIVLKSLPPKAQIREQLGFTLADRILINVARLTPQKNHELLIDGFALFLKKHPEYFLVIVGDGGLSEQLKKKVLSIDIKNKVYFAGVRRDVWRFYKTADAYVSTSILEGLSMTYLEALTAGLPLVATATAGTDELIVNNQNGFVIPASDAKTVVETLEKLSVADLARLSQGAVKMAKEFDIKNMASKYQELISQSLGESLGSRSQRPNQAQKQIKFY